MALRKALAYSKKRNRAYTRSSKKSSKNYIKTLPQNKIVKFKMGAVRDFQEGKLKNIIKLISLEEVLIRDNSLESARKYILRLLNKEIPGNFYLEVKIFPHHILRENKTYSGASKGDRINTGMAQSFGKTIGRAAFVRKNQPVFLLALLNKNDRKLGISTLNKIKSKLPCNSRLMMEKLE